MKWIEREEITQAQSQTRLIWQTISLRFQLYLKRFEMNYGVQCFCCLLSTKTRRKSFGSTLLIGDHLALNLALDSRVIYSAEWQQKKYWKIFINKITFNWAFVSIFFCCLSSSVKAFAPPILLVNWIPHQNSICKLTYNISVSFVWDVMTSNKMDTIVLRLSSSWLRAAATKLNTGSKLLHKKRMVGFEYNLRLNLFRGF